MKRYGMSLVLLALAVPTGSAFADAPRAEVPAFPPMPKAVSSFGAASAMAGSLSTAAMRARPTNTRPPRFPARSID